LHYWRWQRHIVRIYTALNQYLLERIKSEFISFIFNLMAWRCDPSYLQQNKESKMSALILFGISVVPIALTLSVWSDVRSIEETINKRKLDASLLSMPGNYHTVRKED
jgi:hypothetical protein